LYQIDEMIRFFVALREMVPKGLLQGADERRPGRCHPQAQERRGARRSLLCWLGASQGDAGLALASPCRDFIPKTNRFPDCGIPYQDPEYLAAGCLWFRTRGLGDMDRVLIEDRVGVLVGDYSPATLAAALTILDALLRDPACQPGARRALAGASVLRKWEPFGIRALRAS